MADNWYVRIGGGQMGPYSLDDLQKMAKSGELKPNSQVSKDRSTWRDATSVGGLSFSASSAGGKALAREIGTWAGVGTQQARAALADFREMNFRKEVIPIDGSNFGSLTGDFAFWAVALLGVMPLMIRTFEDQHVQLTLFALFFAALWGVIFKHFVVKHEGSWKLPVASLFFTGLVGLNLLLLIYNYLPKSYVEMPSSKDLFISLFGYVVQVGVCEELIKFLPVLIYVLWKRSQADPFTIVLLGIFSGLGFAAFENLGYAQKAIRLAFGLTVAGAQSAGREGLEAGFAAGVEGAMITAMARSLSLVFTHAVWAGVFAYFFAAAFVAGRRWIALLVVGLLVSAVLHGTYDWFCTMQPTIAAVIAGGSFVLFYGYLVKLRGATGTA